MQRYFLTLATSSLLLGLPAGPVLAQEGETGEENTQRIEELTTEIDRLQQQLDALKGQVDAGADSAAVEAEVEKVEKAAAEVVQSAQDIEEDLKLWSGDMELGYVKTSGNTNETNLKSRADITRERGKWRFTINYDSLNSKSENERTAERYFYSNRLAYAFTEHNYAFGYASYEDDRFSGFDFQATAAFGYGRRIYNEPDLKWDFEVGPGYRYSELDDGLSPDNTEEAILRLFTKLAWDITDATTFSQSLSSEVGDESTVSKSITSLKTQLIGKFSLKLSHTIKYTDEVPANKKHAEEETAVTLAYSF